MPDNLAPKLFKYTNETYGQSFKADLLEQYKLYVESAEKVSGRRVLANNFLLTVNAFLITLYGILAADTYRSYWTTLVPVAGVLISLTWYEIIISYSKLNGIKFKIIHELEQYLPAALYGYEWQLAEKGKGTAYRPLTHLESWVPIIFMILYILLAILGFLGLV